MDLRLPPALDRRFEAVIFDWDGTAVPDRSADASRAARAGRRAVRARARPDRVTGTHVGNVDGQLGARPAGPGRLYFCVNRGSEVFAASTDGIELVDRRQATPEEEAALDARRGGHRRRARPPRRSPQRSVAHRLNRRKIDLIPEPEWADPPKARIGELLAAVQARLRAPGSRVSATRSRLRSQPRALPGSPIRA